MKKIIYILIFTILLSGCGQNQNINVIEETEKYINYLNSKNVKTLDYTIRTHPYEDHIGSMNVLL